MNKDIKTSKVVGVRLTDPLHGKLRDLSRKYEVSISTLVRIAINRLVRDSDKEGEISL